MKSLWKLLILGLFMLALPLMVVAQATDTQTVDLGDGYWITVPAEWEVEKLHDGAFRLGDDAITLSVTTPTRLNDLSVDFPDSTNVIDVLINLAFPLDGADITADSVQKARYDNRQAALFTDSEDENIDQIFVAITLSDRTFGYLAFSGAKDDFAAFSPQLDDIIASFDSDRTVNAATGVECTVSTDSANSAQLRVGPGTNRGAISFLPADTDVTVNGRIELDDSSVWYQLDKAEAAPNGTAAAELWVNAEDVDANGDCDSVGETSAPPVIPIIAAPAATAAPGENPPQTNPNAAPGAMPSAGGWIMVLNPVLNASCQGGDNFTFNTAEYFTPTTYGDTLVIRDNSSFVYTSDVFTRIPGTNSFTGTFTYQDGTVAPVRFDLVSSTQMTGYITVNYAIEGTPCSETVTFVATRG